MSGISQSMSKPRKFASPKAQQDSRVSRDENNRQEQGRFTAIAAINKSENKLMEGNLRYLPTLEPSPTYEPLLNININNIFKEEKDNNKATKEDTSLLSARSGSAAHDRPKVDGFRPLLSSVAPNLISRGQRSHICADAYDDTKQKRSLNKRSSMETVETSSSAIINRRSKSGKVGNNELPPKDITARHGYWMNRKSAITKNSPIDQCAIPNSDLNPPVLQKSFSTDILPLFSGRERDLDRAIHRGRVSSLQRMVQLVPDRNRKKDELWGVFRNLDGAFLKFQSKSTANKANIIRNNLIPFLNSYKSHSSIYNMRAEDLDRRANILDRWWNGLLETMQGKLGSSMSGTDRLVVLEGILGLMERPEWRLHPSEFCPLSDRPSHTQHNRRRSVSTNSSTDSDFLLESVVHNIHNTFVRNLISQMAFSVEKMSLRTVPASLVTFSGKTCAYAFFFCRNIAKILIDLWKIPNAALRRLLHSCKMGDSHKDGRRENVLLSFPSYLHVLGSMESIYARKNMQKLTIPIEISHVPWFGSWTERWNGKESDLFYVFAKYYHILLAEFLPPDVSRSDRLAAPGLIQVQSQILVNLDATLHRQANSQTSFMSIRPYTSFDEVLAETDVNATALSFLPSNSIRQVTENRLILLIREFLSENDPHRALSRLCFADVFKDVLRAAACKVSAYDQNACSVLCDFLEEAILILCRFEKSAALSETIIDWPFWQNVCKRMLQSHNISTETRLYSFLYTIWSLISRNQQVKEDFCLNFLLDTDFFVGKFCHWCPMIRAYYMRLLCWRIARLGQNEDHRTHKQILYTISSRLQIIWDFFLNRALNLENKWSQSTAPCNPAPGRRIVIVRTDSHLPKSNAFLTLDGFPPASSKPRITPFKRSSSKSHLTHADTRYNMSNEEIKRDRFTSTSENNNKWNLLRSVLTPSRSRSKSPSLRISDDHNEFSHVTSNKSPTSSSENLLLHHNMSFKFSLEWVDRKATAPGSMRLFCPKLPSHAQVLLDSSPKMNKTTIPTKLAYAEEFAHYTGKALAEWSVVVNECQSFFLRRKQEGVPGDEWVETPNLAVESLRKAA